MPTPKIDELILLMDRAFADSEHSLLKNLASVHEDSWSQIPQGGKRAIQNIVAHVGMFKFMYANHGFDGGGLDYGESPATPAAERLGVGGSGDGVSAGGGMSTWWGLIRGLGG